MKTLVVIPTYNERENINSIITAIRRLDIFALDILVVDDYSGDGTAQAVKDLQPEKPGLYLIERSGKLGLGTAYIAGFKWALKHNYDFIVEMDADLSHDPNDLPGLIEQGRKFDLVIGSRNIPGGGVVNWPFIRRFISRAGSLYARLILGVPIHDFTGGFNGWRTEVLRAIDLDNIQSNGYSFQIEIKYRAAIHKFSWIEWPIIFKERERGTSKMSKKIVAEAIFVVIRLRLRRYREFIKFCLVGALGTLIDVGGLYFLVEFGGWKIIPASVISFLLAVINNFIFNKIWTFRDKNAAAVRQFFKFLSASSVGLLFNIILMWLLLRLGVWYILAKIIIVITVVCWNYFINRLWTFKSSEAEKEENFDSRRIIKDSIKT